MPDATPPPTPPEQSSDQNHGGAPLTPVPRSEGDLILATASSPSTRRPHVWLAVLFYAVIGIGAILGANWLRVGSAVSSKLQGDGRNAGFTLRAHYRYFVRPGTLVLDLRQVDSAAPLDLFRGLFQAADTLAQLGRSFDQVILARSGTPKFVLHGNTFMELGRATAGGENPLYLLRTFPEKLHRASDGQAAYGSREGGLFGVVAQQMQDVSDAATIWASGSASSVTMPSP